MRRTAMRDPAPWTVTGVVDSCGVLQTWEVEIYRTGGSGIQ